MRPSSTVRGTLQSLLVHGVQDFLDHRVRQLLKQVGQVIRLVILCKGLKRAIDVTLDAGYATTNPAPSTGTCTWNMTGTSFPVTNGLPFVNGGYGTSYMVNPFLGAQVGSIL